MTSAGDQEIEIKLPVDDLAAVRARVEAAGAALQRPRVFESNQILDTADKSLRSRGELIRIRTVGEECVLTFKGRGETRGAHKCREELEVTAGNAARLQEIFGRLGYHPSFRYDKYRTEYRLGGGTITLDETPIGLFLELEGEPDWIDATAGRLGYHATDYITASYGELFRNHCRDRHLPDGDMVFDGPPPSP